MTAEDPNDPSVLFLVNGAHGIRPFFAGVGAALESMPCRPVYAVDSHFTDFLYPDAVLERAYVFSDYFARNANRTDLPKAFGDVNVSGLLFSDVDRLTWTRAGKRKGDAYYEALVANLAWFFTELLDREQPRLVVYENVSNAFASFAHRAASDRGIPFLGIVASRLPGRIDLLDSATGRNSNQSAIYRDLVSGRTAIPPDLARQVEHYIEHLDEQHPDYMNGSRLEMGPVARYAHRAPMARGFRALKYALARRSDLHFAFQVPLPYLGLPEQLLREVERHFKLRVLEHLFYESHPRLDRPYFVYPIQVHPESSTSVDGPAFVDEWASILGTVQNLPHGMWLYVKDHPHAAGRQTLDFYERLGRLPNVVLVHPGYDRNALIRASAGVVCATGTLGWEALVLGKPVFVLGEPFYDFFPGCVRLSSIATAHQELGRHRTLKTSPAEIRALVASYFLCTEAGTLNLEVEARDETKIAWVADIIKNRLEQPRGRADTPPREPASESVRQPLGDPQGR